MNTYKINELKEEASLIETKLEDLVNIIEHKTNLFTEEQKKINEKISRFDLYAANYNKGQNKVVFNDFREKFEKELNELNSKYRTEFKEFQTQRLKLNSKLKNITKLIKIYGLDINEDFIELINMIERSIDEDVDKLCVILKFLVLHKLGYLHNYIESESISLFEYLKEEDNSINKNTKDTLLRTIHSIYKSGFSNLNRDRKLPNKDSCIKIYKSIEGLLKQYDYDYILNQINIYSNYDMFYNIEYISDIKNNKNLGNLFLKISEKKSRQNVFVYNIFSDEILNHIKNNKSNWIFSFHNGTSTIVRFYINLILDEGTDLSLWVLTPEQYLPKKKFDLILMDFPDTLPIKVPGKHRYQDGAISLLTAMLNSLNDNGCAIVRLTGKIFQETPNVVKFRKYLFESFDVESILVTGSDYNPFPETDKIYSKLKLHDEHNRNHRGNYLYAVISKKDKNLSSEITNIINESFLGVIQDHSIKNIDDYILSQYYNFLAFAFDRNYLEVDNGVKLGDLVKKIPKANIKKKKYSLNTSVYFDNFFTNIGDDNKVKFSDIIQKSKIYIKEEVKDDKFYQINVLKSTDKLSTEILHNEDLDIFGKDQLFVEGPVLLVGFLGSKIGDIKVHYFDKKGYINLPKKFLAYDLDESRALKDYITLLFSSTEFLMQFRSLLTGLSLEKLSLFKAVNTLGDYLLNLIIDLPEIANQKLIINAKVESEKDKTKTKELLHKKLDEVTNDNYTNFATLKHETGDNRNAIATNAKLLINFFKENEGDSVFKEISEKFKKEHDSYSIVEALSMIVESITGLTRQIESQKYVIALERYNLEEQSINELESMFLNFKEKYKKSFELEFQIEYLQNDIVNALALFNYKLLETMFDNLLRNSREHGFSNTKLGFGNQVRVNVIIDAAEDIIKLIYSDNGVGFPEDLTRDDFITVGKSNTGKLGRGEGGRIIHEIAKIHKNDDWQLDTDINSEFKTRFTFNLKPTFYE